MNCESMIMRFKNGSENDVNRVSVSWIVGLGKSIEIKYGEEVLYRKKVQMIHSMKMACRLHADYKNNFFKFCCQQVCSTHSN